MRLQSLVTYSIVEFTSEKTETNDSETLGWTRCFHSYCWSSFWRKTLVFWYLYFSFVVREAKAAKITATGIIQSDRISIPPQFEVKEEMERDEYKSVVISNVIIFKWMNTKHVFLASNGCENIGIVPVSRQLKNKQLIEINCPKAMTNCNKFIHGVDRFNQRIFTYAFWSKV